MRIPQITCSCSEIVLKSLGEESKIRSKVLVIRDSQVYAVCKGCNNEVRVPLCVDTNEVNPPLFIKKH